MATDSRGAIAQGQAALAAGDAALARASFAAVDQDETDFAEAQRLLVDTELLADDPQAALGHARRLEALAPEDARTWIALSRVYEALEDHRRARDASAEALARDPHSYDLWLLHANHAVRLSRFDDAVADYRQAQALDPGRVEAIANEAAALDKLGRRDEAIDRLKAALSRHGDNKGLWLNIGRLYANSDDHESAVVAYEKAIELDAGFVDAWINLSIAQLRAQRPVEALAAAGKCLQAAPADRSATALAVMAYQQLGDHDNYRQLYAFDDLIYTAAIDLPSGYASAEAFNHALADAVLTHPTLIHEPAGKATRHGKQTGNLLHGASGDVFDALRQQVMKHIDRFLARPFERPGHPYASFDPDESELYMWATVLEEQGHQHPHIHPAGWVSGVYYVQVPTREGEVDPEAGWIEFGRPDIDVPGIDEHNTDLRRLRPQEGELFLFPSYFFHRTIPYHGDRPRISIAFDLVPKRLRRRSGARVVATDADFASEFARLVQARRLADAESLCQQALERDDSDPEALSALGQLYLIRGENDLAIATLRNAIESGPGNLNARLALAGALRQQSAHEQALGLLEATPRAQVPRVLAARAELQIDLGRFEDAGESLRSLRVAEPDNGRAAWLLAMLDADGPGVDDLAAIAASAAPAEMIGLQFALARLHERAGQGGAAVAALRRANAMVHSRFAGKTKAADVALLTSVFNRALIERHVPGTNDAQQGDGLVFIVGMPRTGSTLVERVLSAHPDAVAAGEHTILWQALAWLGRTLPAGSRLPDNVDKLSAGALAEAGRGVEEALRRTAGEAQLVVVRELGSYPLLGLLQLMLPGARVIRCRRDVSDMRWSCYAHWFDAAVPFVYDLPTLDRRIADESMLWRHFDSVLTLRKIQVEYESLVTNFHDEVARLAAFCGLAHDPAMIGYAALQTPVLSGDRVGVRKPVYTTSIGRGAAFESLLRATSGGEQ